MGNRESPLVICAGLCVFRCKCSSNLKHTRYLLFPVPGGSRKALSVQILPKALIGLLLPVLLPGLRASDRSAEPPIPARVHRVLVRPDRHTNRAVLRVLKGFICTETTESKAAPCSGQHSWLQGSTFTVRSRARVRTSAAQTSWFPSKHTQPTQCRCLQSIRSPAVAINRLRSLQKQHRCVASPKRQPAALELFMLSFCSPLPVAVCGHASSVTHLILWLVP